MLPISKFFFSLFFIILHPFCFGLSFRQLHLIKKCKTMKETLFHMHDTIRIMPANACFFDVFRFSFPLNFDLLLNFVFKLYHKTCEQFYRNFGLYEKSPNSFLPGLSRSIINQFRFHNFLCLCLASVHLPHPFHLVFGFQLFGHAVLLCQ